MIWNKEMECADRETMRALQLKKLKDSLRKFGVGLLVYLIIIQIIMDQKIMKIL